ncbi:hypothetical protein [Novosphingobium sp. ST904]|nr:hypothetical protein [Novosphingobium sp. ST904]
MSAGVEADSILGASRQTTSMAPATARCSATLSPNAAGLRAGA